MSEIAAAHPRSKLRGILKNKGQPEYLLTKDESLETAREQFRGIEDEVKD